MNHFRWLTISTVAMLSLLSLAACSSGARTPSAPAPFLPTAVPNIQPTATLIPQAPSLAMPIPTAAAEPDVAFDEPFQLQVGQTLSVGSTDLRVTFIEASEDSRCPSDVVCIWVGQVVVVVALEVGGDDLHSESFTVGNANDSMKDLGGYMVESVSVEPYPVSTGTIDPSYYVLTLKVSPT